LFGLLGLAAVYAPEIHGAARRSWGRRPVRRSPCFAAAFTLLIVALVSPLDALAGQSFAAHMVQHLMLAFAIAPLFVLARLDVASLRALARLLPGGVRHRVLPPVARRATAIARPPVAWTFFAAVLWLWHLPGPYEAALHHEAVHALEHASLLTAGFLFWYPVLAPGRRSRLATLASVGYVLSMALQGGALSALLVFSRVSWYSAYDRDVFGMSPLESQQAGGAVMGIVCNIVSLAVASTVFVRWIDGGERDFELAPPEVSPRRLPSAMRPEVQRD
jgi:putative membrane protein